MPFADPRFPIIEPISMLSWPSHLGETLVFQSAAQGEQCVLKPHDGRARVRAYFVETCAETTGNVSRLILAVMLPFRRSRTIP